MSQKQSSNKRKRDSEEAKAASAEPKAEPEPKPIKRQRPLKAKARVMLVFQNGSDLTTVMRRAAAMREPLELPKFLVESDQASHDSEEEVPKTRHELWTTDSQLWSECKSHDFKYWQPFHGDYTACAGVYFWCM
jgi:hypothetical protein